MKKFVIYGVVIFFTYRLWSLYNQNQTFKGNERMSWGDLLLTAIWLNPKKPGILNASSAVSKDATATQSYDVTLGYSGYDQSVPGQGTVRTS